MIAVAAYTRLCFWEGWKIYTYLVYYQKDCFDRYLHNIYVGRERKVSRRGENFLHARVYVEE